jgi:hypothetical protein
MFKTPFPAFADARLLFTVILSGGYFIELAVHKLTII